MMGHHFPDPPQIVERDRAVLSSAVAVGSSPGRHREVAIADHALGGNDAAHLLDGLAMFAGQRALVRVVKEEAAQAIVVALPAHHDSPVRQLFHRARREPSAPIEEFALLVTKLLPETGRVVDDAAVKGEILAACDNLQRVELEILHRAHGELGAAAASPTSARPKALLAENESPRGLARERDVSHTGWEIAQFALPAPEPRSPNRARRALPADASAFRRRWPAPGALRF